MPDAGAKGSVVQGNNWQAAVDARAQFIVAADVTDDTNDKQPVPPMLAPIVAHTDQVPRTMSMDVWHFSEWTYGTMSLKHKG